MKINKIKAMCKDEEQAIIYNDFGRQYLGTARAAYPVDNIEIQKTSIPTLFDWPSAIHDMDVTEMAMEGSMMMPEGGIVGIPFREGGKLFPEMEINGWTAMSDSTTREILFVPEELIRAAEKTEGYQMFHRAENANGEPLVIISDGMIVTGIVRPIMQRAAERIAAAMRCLGGLTPVGSPDPNETKKNEDQIEGQMTMEAVMEGGIGDAAD